MADRFFANVMPDFIVEEEEEEEEDGDPKETKMEKQEKKNEGVVSASLKRLLFLPYEITAQEFMRGGMEITDTIVEKTWLETRGSVKDFSLYTGSLGTAFLLLKAYEATRNKDCLTKCLEILTACESASCRMRELYHFPPFPIIMGCDIHVWPSWCLCTWGCCSEA